MKKFGQVNWAETKNSNAVEFELFDVAEIDGHQVRDVKTKEVHIVEVSKDIFDNDDYTAAFEVVNDYLKQKGIEVIKPKNFIIL